jgi:Helix-turn-helix domain
MNDHDGSFRAASDGIKPAALKLKQACQYLGGLSPVTVRRLIDRGLIKRNLALRHIVISVAELDRFLSR